MEKPAVNDYPIHEFLRRRWSPRSFSSRPVDNATLCSLFEAARWAASSFNEQPWRFFVATKEDSASFRRLLSCLTEGNRVWAGHAPVLMFSAVKLAFERNDKPNRVALHDVGLAIGNLTMQAMSLGLFVHQMAGVDLDRLRTEYAIPAGFEPLAAAAIGYPGEADDLPEPLRRQESALRSRHPLSALVFGHAWHEPAAFLTVERVIDQDAGPA